MPGLDRIGEPGRERGGALRLLLGAQIDRAMVRFDRGTATRTLKLKLTSKARKLARRAQRKVRRVKAKVTVDALDAAGNGGSARRKVTLKGRRR